MCLTAFFLQQKEGTRYDLHISDKKRGQQESGGKRNEMKWKTHFEMMAVALNSSASPRIFSHRADCSIFNSFPEFHQLKRIPTLTLWIPSFLSCLDHPHDSENIYKKKVSDRQQPANRLSHSRLGHADDDVTRVHRLRSRRRLVERHVRALCAAQPSTHPSSWECG